MNNSCTWHFTVTRLHSSRRRSPPGPNLARVRAAVAVGALNRASAATIPRPEQPPQRGRMRRPLQAVAAQQHDPLARQGKPYAAFLSAAAATPTQWTQRSCPRPRPRRPRRQPPRARAVWCWPSWPCPIAALLLAGALLTEEQQDRAPGGRRVFWRIRQRAGPPPPHASAPRPPSAAWSQSTWSPGGLGTSTISGASARPSWGKMPKASAALRVAATAPGPTQGLAAVAAPAVPSVVRRLGPALVLAPEARRVRKCRRMFLEAQGVELSVRAVGWQAATVFPLRPPRRRRPPLQRSCSRGLWR